MSDLLKMIAERFWVQVDSRGAKNKRLKCPPGYKLNDTGTACVPIGASEKQTMRVASRKMVKNKAAQGASLQTKTARKVKKAFKFRARYGL
ncbi:gp68-like protein [Delftia phage PhiW-14]|uniref:Gp68-like protein n=1 Tax=Delftia phage PhiW-14 TaxID=665032 RepID=C9DG13_BPW14|nr:head scaffolding protein [Delftia phage PhiW-14]ACV50064.1 gp68-like protein [Delftia phage PhiW-14]